MTAFVFVGDPRMEGKDTTPDCKLFGLVFQAGVPVEVTDATIAGRLRRHSHFAEVTLAADDVESRPRRGRPPKVRDGDA